MRAFTVKNLIWTGAQIALAVILLPFVAILIHLILPDGMLTIVINSIQEIPVIGQMLAMLGTLEAELEGGALPSVSEYLLYTVEQVEKASVETAVIGSAFTCACRWAHCCSSAACRSCRRSSG